MLGCLSCVTLIFHSKFSISWRFQIWYSFKKVLSTLLFVKQVFWRVAINQDKFTYFCRVGNPIKILVARLFWSKFGVICCLNHENPSRIAEVRRILVQRKSILRNSVTTTTKFEELTLQIDFLHFLGNVGCLSCATIFFYWRFPVIFVFDVDWRTACQPCWMCTEICEECQNPDKKWHC